MSNWSWGMSQNLKDVGYITLNSSTASFSKKDGSQRLIELATDY